MSEENTQEDTLTKDSLGTAQEELVSTELNTEVLDIVPSTEVEDISKEASKTE